VTKIRSQYNTIV